MPDGDPGASRRIGKTGSEKRKPTPGMRLGWPDVVRAVQSDEARSQTMSRYNASGYCPDDFAHKLAARAVMADALTRVEDILESRGPSTAAERARIRTVRRQLEVELYP